MAGDDDDRDVVFDDAECWSDHVSNVAKTDSYLCKIGPMGGGTDRLRVIRGSDDEERLVRFSIVQITRNSLHTDEGESAVVTVHGDAGTLHSHWHGLADDQIEDLPDGLRGGSDVEMTCTAAVVHMIHTSKMNRMRWLDG